MQDPIDTDRMVIYRQICLILTYLKINLDGLYKIASQMKKKLKRTFNVSITKIVIFFVDLVIPELLNHGSKLD